MTQIKIKEVGTGIFNYKGLCGDCKNKSLIDINGYCENCYIEEVGKEINKFKRYL